MHDLDRYEREALEAARQEYHERVRLNRVASARALLAERSDLVFRFPDTSDWMHQRPIPERACGECSECCIGIPIGINPGSQLGDYVPAGETEAILKPAFARCRFLAANCSVYDRRPSVCSHFQCAWLKGLPGIPTMRPDIGGLILEWEQRPILREYHPAGGHFIAWETTQNGMDREPADSSIRELTMKAGFLVQVIRSDALVFCDPIGRRKLCAIERLDDGGIRYSIGYLDWRAYMKSLGEEKWGWRLDSDLLGAELQRIGSKAK